VKHLGGLIIGDLGISKSVATINRNTTKCVGSVNYMSPEIIDESETYSDKIDIWSLGCVVYELITQEKLFDDKTEYKIKTKILQAEINFPSQIEPGLKQILKG
jgi:serine/threonine protein kinase